MDKQLNTENCVVARLSRCKMCYFAGLLFSCFAFSQDFERDGVAAGIFRRRSERLDEARVGRLQLRGKRMPAPPSTSVRTSHRSICDSADLTIDLRTIDTAQFSGMYRFWTEVPVDRVRGSLSPVLDADHDNRKEVYGSFHDYTTIGFPSRIYEFNGDSAFTFAYQYPDTLNGAIAGADIDIDGLVDLVYMTPSSNIVVMTQPDQQSLPTIMKFFYQFGGDASRASFYDINSDGLLEMIYQRHGSPTPTHACVNGSNYIEQYDSAANSFRVVYCNRPQLQNTEGFAFGDFDMDGKQNFSNGGINGEVFIYEHQGADSFSVMLVDTVAASNAYLSVFTNDLDDNGRPELWIGGDTYIGGVSSTRLSMYESMGDDSYQCVYRIDLIGAIAFFAGNMGAADMDNDGKDEVLLCISQTVLFFKNTGPRSYALWYMRRNELAEGGLNSVIYGASTSDFDNDGNPEILVTMDHIRTPGEIRFFTRIYKYNGPTGVLDYGHFVPSTYSIEQNYPNPFNSQTLIKYELPRNSTAILKVYDILGREVRELQNTVQSAGKHEVWWDGKDNGGRELPSGVYFVRFQAGGFVSTIKAVVLK